jgi:tetratricopeptide (TPR) repeat protein
MPNRATATADTMTAVRELEKHGHYARALRLVDALLPLEGQSADLLAAKARLLNSEGRLMDALRAAELATDLWPTHPSGHAARAETLELSERHAEALAAADQALALDARDVVALRARAVALAETGRTDEAARSAHQALRLAPDEPDSLLTLEIVLEKVDPAAALREIGAQVRRAKTVGSLVARAMVRLALDEVAAAEEDAREAVALDPDNEAAVLVLMLVDLTNQRWDDVLARAGSPPVQDNLSAVNAAGMAYQMSRRPADAEKALLLGLEQQPTNATLLTVLRAAQLDLKEWGALSLTCSRMLAVAPDDDTLIIRARASCELDNPEAAIRDLERVLGRDPTNSPALAIRSLAHVMLERPSQALTDADAAIALGADWDSLAQRARMLAFLGLGRRREAEEAARRILRERPGDELAQLIVQAADARWNKRLETMTDLAKTALQVFGA